MNSEENQNFIIKDDIIVGKNYSSSGECTSISKLILEALNDSPNFVGQYDVRSGKEITFAEMKDRSIRCALWLRKQGIGKNDIVSISTPNQIDDYVPYLATLYLGAIYSPWYYDVTTIFREYLFKLIQPKIVFVDEQSIESLAKVAKSLNIESKFIVFGNHPDFQSLEDILNQQTNKEVANFCHEEVNDPKTRIAAILFSSGSTGIQKGTTLSYDAIVNNRVNLLIPSGANLMWYSTLSWITGSYLLTMAIRCRSTRFIHDFDIKDTFKALEKYKIQWLLLSPNMLNLLWKAKVFERYSLLSLETIALTGTRPNIKIIEDIGKALPHIFICNSYGMTELGSWVAFQTKNRKIIDSIGYITDIVQMKVIDTNTGRILGPNQEGELCFKLKYYMIGYYKNPQETEKMFDSEGWLHTGDLGYYTNDGEIIFVAKKKEVIHVKNKYQVSPTEIEGILTQHPDVLEAAVTCVPHEIDIELPIAFVKLRPNAKVTADELRTFPVKYNKYFELIGGVIFVDNIPITTTGKKNLKELKEMAKHYIN